MFAKIAEQGAPDQNLANNRNRCRIGIIRSDKNISEKDQNGLLEILVSKNFNGQYCWTHDRVSIIINDEMPDVHVSKGMVAKHRQGVCKCTEI